MYSVYMLIRSIILMLITHGANIALKYNLHTIPEFDISWAYPCSSLKLIILVVESQLQAIIKLECFKQASFSIDKNVNIGSRWCVGFYK